MRRLDLKALRDIRHMRGQAIAVVVIVACGIASFVAMRSMVPHLTEAQSTFYITSRFPHVWANVKRAPLRVAEEIAMLPGVARLEARVAGEVVVDVPGLTEPATARVVGVPTTRAPNVSVPIIRSGRALAPRSSDEVLVSESFAEANRLAPGDSIGAIVNGVWKRFRIVGIALSPEHVIEMRAGDLFPDNQRYGILWIDADAAASAFGMRGAWNEIAIQVATGASRHELIARLDEILRPYGTTGAYGRDLQGSHRFLSDEIAQTRTFANLAPAIFLGVAAMLLHIVLSRLASSQREQIGMLKAFGVSNWALVRHFLLIALIPVGIGAVVGVVLGHWLAGQLASLYAQYYRLPGGPLQFQGGVAVIATVISVLAAVVGALSAVRRVARLQAAEAMRPETPPRFEAGIAEKLGVDKWLSPIARMTLRGIERRPGRSALSVFGMALAVAVMMIGMFAFDSVNYIREISFGHAQREDMTVSFAVPRNSSALNELAAIRGVTRVEPLVSMGVRLRHGHRSRHIGLVGVPSDAALRRVVNAKGEQVAVPARALLMSKALADLLAVQTGDAVDVEFLLGKRHVRTMRIGGTFDDLLGTNAYVTNETLYAISGERDVVYGAALSIDPLWRDSVYSVIKRMPAVSSVSIRTAYVAAFDKVMAESFNVTLFTLLFFAVAIAGGVVYNTARVALSERGRELASLRVLGFTRQETARMLFGEQALLAAVAVPVGYAIGALFSWGMIQSLNSDLFRLPFVLRPRTYALALFVLVAAGLGSSILVRRRLDRLDLVAVLKTRE